MKPKRLTAVFIIAAILITTTTISFRAALSYPSLPIQPDTSDKQSFFTSLETLITELFPFNSELRSGLIKVRFESGYEEQNGIFITEDYLLENIPPADESVTFLNTEGIKNFTSTYRVPTYMMLVPTSCGINQHMLGSYSSTLLFNQKKYIEDVYRDLEGIVSTVDVYPTLFASHDLPLYYKTQSDLTSTGSYYLYRELASRLNLTPHSFERYDTEHNTFSFYGDVYDKSPYKDVGQDSISLYHFNRYDREYLVERLDEDGISLHHELFFKDAAELGSPMDVFLGGEATMIDITVFSPYDTELLVFGDTHTLTYLPFLAPHYGRITFVDAEKVTKELLSELDIIGYEQILFAYSVDSYMQGEVVWG